jgi:hypothetical protein
MEVHEPRRFGTKPIQIWRAQDRIAVGTDIAVALIVREDEDDVRPGRSFAGPKRREGTRQRGTEEKEVNGLHGRECAEREKWKSLETGSDRHACHGGHFAVLINAPQPLEVY